MPQIDPSIEWAALQNAVARTAEQPIEGEIEVSATLARATTALLHENGIASGELPTEAQQAQLYRALESGVPLSKADLAELNGYVWRFGLYQVAALMADAIFVIDIKLAVKVVNGVITATWQHVGEVD